MAPRILPLQSGMITSSAEAETAGGRAMVEDRRLRWVQSGGGPLVVLPQSHLASWGGSNRPRPADDYGRACGVPGYQGVLAAGAAEALVLGDVPLLTAPCRLDGVRYLLRWLYAPGEAELLAAFRAAAPSLAAVEVSAFRHPGGRAMLFDAAMPGRSRVRGGVAFRLAAGRYDVVASVWEMDEVGFVSHALRPVG
jgi:Immunity protein 21